MKIDLVRDCPIVKSARVVQVAGLFDVEVTEKSRIELHGEIPIEDREWNIGLIVGPSGSGKSTIAREVFGADLVTGFDWPTDGSILDGFPDIGIKQISAYLNAVGFGSIPNWLRPFQVLSNGEQFRATVARALAESADAKRLVAIDEFTSVVDRQVAKVASHSVQKAVRGGKRQLVAITCHYDVIEWLQPDWVYEPHLGAFEWRSLQRRPPLSFEIRSVGRAVWNRFSKYHYLSSALAANARCTAGFIDGRCVAFCAIRKFPHPNARNIFAEHRTVVLPDYQGLGLSRVMAEWIGQHLWERGFRFHSVTVHPAIIAQKARSPRWHWERTGFKGPGQSTDRALRHRQHMSQTRLSSTFVYVAPKGTPSPRVPKLEGPLLAG